MRIEALRGSRVAVWGAGREGRAAITALRARLPGQDIGWIVTPAESEQAQAESGEGVRVVALPVDAALLARYDVVVKSPGISPYRPPVPDAMRAGVRFVSSTALWFAETPGARVVAVTGTKGKSTTTALVAHLLRSAGRRVALCGNIGLPLLELLDPPLPPDWWVIELSSFQTPGLGAVPEIGVVLNLHPEHLDWHGSLETYYRDKMSLLGEPGRRPRASVLSSECSYPAALVPESGVHRFGDARGFHLGPDDVRLGGRSVLALADLPLPGRHNAMNACAALTAVELAGEDARALAPALRTFRPLPHRLQALGERAGLTWINDSIATTPHATCAALAHVAGRATVVLVGGYDRGVDWREVGTGIAQHAPLAVLAMGQNGARIVAELAPSLPSSTVLREVGTLEAAVAEARVLTPPGGVVLLSPGAPSFGAFRDYVERGGRFAGLAGFDPEAITQIDGLGIR